jgi:hypothetical protein
MIYFFDRGFLDSVPAKAILIVMEKDTRIAVHKNNG